MPDPEHFKILKAGAEFLNKWREENSDIKPNLKEANLIKAKLMDANLNGADLRMANFVETRLEGTNISNSRIYEISGMEFKD